MTASVPSTSGAAAEAVSLAIVLAADVSTSVNDERFQLQRQGYAEAFANPAVIAAIRSSAHGRIAVTFVEWSGAGSQRVIVPWTVIAAGEDGRTFADRILREPRSFDGWTSISGAIDYAA